MLVFIIETLEYILIYSLLPVLAQGKFDKVCVAKVLTRIVVQRKFETKYPKILNSAGGDMDKSCS